MITFTRHSFTITLQLLRSSSAVRMEAEVESEALGYAMVLALERHRAMVIIWIVEEKLASTNCFKSFARRK